MSPAQATGEKFGEGSVTIRRTVDAPLALVWRAWTDPQMMTQWFGPRMFTTPVCELDVRVGGALRIVMRGPDGADYPMQGVFTEVVPEQRLVFTNMPLDKDGNRLMEGETRVTFADAGGKTELTVTSHMVGLAPIARQMLAGMEMGWTQTIDRLEEVVRDSAPSP
jgi:uncharacterized protein YndB with AHSA1/START domain